VNALAVSPDGTVVAATTTITARTWEIATGIPGVTISGGHDYLDAVAFDPSGALLGIARTWDAATGAARATLRGHAGQVKAVSFAPDGSLLATASDDRTARVWDPLSGAHVRTLSGHDSWVYGVAFSPRGDLIATASLGSDRRQRSASGHPGPPAVRRVHHAAA
jgi:WD40 repeat protein